MRHLLPGGVIGAAPRAASSAAATPGGQPGASRGRAAAAFAGAALSAAAAGAASASGAGRRGAATGRRAVAAMVEKTPLQTRIEEIIALSPVVVISKTTCPYCAQAKEALKKAGARDVAVIELDKLGASQGAEIQEYMGTLTGATTVPRVFIGRKFVGGGTDTVKLQESGQLSTLVKEAEKKHEGELRGVHEATIVKDETEWRKELDPKTYRVLRQRGTEPPNSHEYNKFLPKQGYFACAGCNLPLYSATSKYASSCGWPVFDKCYESQEMGCHVGTRSDGSGSLEIFCPRCNGHLGHVFFDAFSASNPNGERH